MKITAEPRSDQWNADDFIGGSRTFTVAGVKPGSAEQKYDIELVGEARFWRPPLTMLRLLISAWGDDATAWVGRKVTLYRDETVRFGSDAVGGIRISHLSHLPNNKPLTVKLTSTRGRRASYTVEPLIAPPITSDDQATDFLRDIEDAASLDVLTRVAGELKTVDLGAHKDKLLAAWTARRQALSEEPAE